MKYKEIENKIVMTEFDSFNIEQILECGQCFRFTKLDDMKYIIVAYNKVLHIYQNDEAVEFYPCSKEDFENIWMDYFDLNNDYISIKSKISEIDNIMAKAVMFAPGIRILNQEPWECLISFIISQNNRIPMIKQVIKNISEMYGNKLGDYYCFPSVKQLSNVDNDSLRLCKTGFRSAYISDAVYKVYSNEINIGGINELTTEEARNTLMSIKGVGPKVADCTLLFSLRRREVFPTDVWVKRVMEHFYFEGQDTSIKKIHNLAEEKFGDLAGYAQQYLFHYARQLKIGAK